MYWLVGNAVIRWQKKQCCTLLKFIALEICSVKQTSPKRMTAVKNESAQHEGPWLLIWQERSSFVPNQTLEYHVKWLPWQLHATMHHHCENKSVKNEYWWLHLEASLMPWSTVPGLWSSWYLHRSNHLKILSLSIVLCSYASDALPAITCHVSPSFLFIWVIARRQTRNRIFHKAFPKMRKLNISIVTILLAAYWIESMLHWVILS